MKDYFGHKLLDAAKGGSVFWTRFWLLFAAANYRDSNGGDTALMWAACRGHSKIAALLIEKGAALDIQDSAGDTALIFAAFHGHTEIAALLRAAGAKESVA